MKELVKGHRFELDHVDGTGKSILQFVQREPFHQPKEGVLNQEVIRVLIRRIQVLNSETPWEGNVDILYHLRMVLLLHEFRAMARDVKKHKLLPEEVKLDKRGHFNLEYK